MRATCDSCEFFDETHCEGEKPPRPDAKPVAGYCRRYAPVPPGITQKLGFTEPDTPRLAQWPIVAADDWCGEFAKRSGSA